MADETPRASLTFDILREADSIAQRRGFPKKSLGADMECSVKSYFSARSPVIRGPRSRDFLFTCSSRFSNAILTTYEPKKPGPVDFAATLNRAMLSMQRQLTIELSSQTVTATQIAELRSEIQSMNHRLTRLEKVRLGAVEQLAGRYVNMASPIEVVKEILLHEDEDAVTIWTVIDGTPFEDESRTPIYDAQVKILKDCDVNTPLDFHMVNLSELPADTKREHIIPTNSRLIWSRQVCPIS